MLVMASRILVRLALSMLLLAEGRASAQPIAQQVESSEDVILGAWSDPAKCNASNAAKMTLDQVVMSGAALNGRCVAVEGFWVARTLFATARDADRKRSNVAPSLRGKRLGIYARDEILERGPSRAARYLMVGVIGQCETEWPNAMMVMGYCHYTGGPIIKVAQALPQARHRAR